MGTGPLGPAPVSAGKARPETPSSFESPVPGSQTFEEEVVIPRGTETRTYKLTKSNATLVSVTTEERPLPPSAVVSPTSSPSAKPEPPSLAKAAKGWLAAKPSAKPTPAALSEPASKHSATKTAGSPKGPAPQKQTQDSTPKAEAAEKPAQEKPAQEKQAKDEPPADSGKGLIRVNARPYADVFFRGKPWGVTPIDIEVEPGNHEILLKYLQESHTCKVTVAAGKPASCNFDFVPEDSATPEEPDEQKKP